MAPHHEFDGRRPNMGECSGSGHKRSSLEDTNEDAQNDTEQPGSTGNGGSRDSRDSMDETLARVQLTMINSLKAARNDRLPKHDRRLKTWEDDMEGLLKVKAKLDQETRYLATTKARINELEVELEASGWSFDEKVNKWTRDGTTLDISTPPELDMKPSGKTTKRSSPPESPLTDKHATQKRPRSDLKRSREVQQY